VAALATASLQDHGIRSGKARYRIVFLVITQALAHPNTPDAA
jgi:hypothetical protein